jgi:hypothetical protein
MCRRIARFFLLVVIAFVALVVFANLATRNLPPRPAPVSSTPRPPSATPNPLEATRDALLAEQTAIAAELTKRAPTPAPLEGADPAIVQTQAFFTDQQTQAASGQSVVQPAENVEPIETLIVYAQGSLNVRECPERTCAVVGPLLDGERVLSTGMVRGEEIEAGNVVWYRVDYYGRTGFVYSEYVSQQPPTAAPTSRPPTQPVVVSTRQPVQSPYTCNGVDDLDCGDFAGYPAGSALAHSLMCNDEDDLDGDEDGLVCE